MKRVLPWIVPVLVLLAALYAASYVVGFVVAYESARPGPGVPRSGPGSQGFESKTRNSWPREGYRPVPPQDIGPVYP